MGEPDSELVGGGEFGGRREGNPYGFVLHHWVRSDLAQIISDFRIIVGREQNCGLLHVFYPLPQGFDPILSPLSGGLHLVSERRFLIK